MFFNRSKVARVRAKEMTTLIMIPRKAVALMFELKGELRMKICTGLVDMTHEHFGRTWSGLESLGDLEMTKIEGHAIQELAAKSIDQRRRKHVISHSDISSSLQTLLGKDKDKRNRDKAILNLVEHMRLACSVPWESSPIKPAVLALALWKLSFKSKRQLARADITSHDRREVLRDGFAIIERSWSIIAGDTKLIYSTHLLSLKEYLGEVGVQFFDQVMIH